MGRGTGPTVVIQHDDFNTVRYHVSGGGPGSALTITLPVHAQMKAPAPRTQTTAAPPVAAATPGVKVDVTSKFFNDPPASKVGMVSGTRGGR